VAKISELIDHAMHQNYMYFPSAKVYFRTCFKCPSNNNYI